MRFFKPKKIISREGVPYLIRWNLFECKLFSIKVHRILKSDYDCFHDHPWAFLSLILKGGYVEHREIPTFSFVGATHYKPVSDEYVRKISKIYHPGQLLFRKADCRHKLEIHQPALTLVITFKKIQDWGFWTNQGFVHWRDYNSKNICE